MNQPLFLHSTELNSTLRTMALLLFLLTSLCGAPESKCEESKISRETVDRVIYGDDLGTARFEEFQKLGEEGFTVVLQRLELTDKRAEQSGALVLIIWGLKHGMASAPLQAKTIGILEKLLMTLDDATRGSVFAASAGIRNKEWLDTVQEYLFSEDERIRLCALAALAASNDKSRARIIANALVKRRETLTLKEARSDKTLLEGEKAIKQLESGK